MEQSVYDEIQLLCQTYGTTGGMGTHNRPESGRGAWVAPYAHPLILILKLRMILYEDSHMTHEDTPYVVR
jgi:hypothetical protein